MVGRIKSYNHRDFIEKLMIDSIEDEDRYNNYIKKIKKDV